VAPLMKTARLVDFETEKPGMKGGQPTVGFHGIIERPVAFVAVK